MEVVWTYIQNASISGLNHIRESTTKLANLFWITIVLMGFLISIVMIHESFIEWSNNPVLTTVETRPISEIKLPKVTVCPPKNTFTDLNYDLMKVAEKVTLTDDKRKEIFYELVEIIEEDDSFIDNMYQINEENRFYNWYHRYTNMYHPEEDKSEFIHSEDEKVQQIYTYATSGVITSKHYGKPFQPENLETNFRYDFYLFAPENTLSNSNYTNVTVHTKIEWEPIMIKLGRESWDDAYLQGVYRLSEVKPFVSASLFPNDLTDWEELQSTAEISRKLSLEEMSNLKNDLEVEKMPGFRFSWWYSEDVIPDVTDFPDWWINHQRFDKFARKVTHKLPSLRSQGQGQTRVRSECRLRDQGTFMITYDNF